MPAKYQIAQINIARMRAPLDDPLLAGFVARLDEINALADAMPGFVWRLQSDEGDATALRPFDDDMILVNMSVWETPAQLREYVYHSLHVEVMKQRKNWFERFDGMYYALWWVPAGHIPSVTEARERLDHLRAHGESAQAFSFKRLYPPPGSADPSPAPDLSNPWPA